MTGPNLTTAQVDDLLVAVVGPVAGFVTFLAIFLLGLAVLREVTR